MAFLLYSVGVMLIKEASRVDRKKGGMVQFMPYPTLTNREKAGPAGQ